MTSIKKDRSQQPLRSQLESYMEFQNKTKGFDFEFLTKPTLMVFSNLIKTRDSSLEVYVSQISLEGLGDPGAYSTTQQA